MRPTPANVLATCRVLPPGELPEWVELLPVGEIVGADGRRFRLDEPASIIAAFASRSLDVVVDWEHASELLAPAGHPAPAAGWVRELELRDGMIWGRVDWTPRGAESVRSREYRYLSPAFRHQNGAVRGLVSVGLTNQPNLDLRALNRVASQPQENDQMDPKLLALLGLASTATAADVLTAVERLNGDLTVARHRAETPPPLDKFVPRADYEVAVNRAATAEKKLDEREKAEREKEIATLIDQASKDGKITPATADYYRGECRQAGGIERFRAFLEKAPKIAGDNVVDPAKLTQGNGAELGADQLAICRNLGITPEKFKATTV